MFIAFSAVTLAACSNPATKRSSARYKAWGATGRRNGHFIKPRAICVDSGEVFVVDTTGRVQVFTEDGEYLRQWSLPDVEKGTPTSIYVDSQDRVIIPDTHYSRMLVYSREGELLDQWGSYGVGPDEFIYPTGVAEGPDGNLYVSEYGIDANRIHVFDPNGNFAGQWGDFGDEAGNFNRAIDIDVDEQGALLVVDMGNQRIQRFDTSGKLLEVIGGSKSGQYRLKDPFDAAIEQNGDLFVCEYGNHCISHFVRDAESGEYAFKTRYGEAGRKAGQFFCPRGIAISKETGALFIADTGNDRVQRLELEGSAR